MHPIKSYELLVSSMFLSRNLSVPNTSVSIVLTEELIFPTYFLLHLTVSFVINSFVVRCILKNVVFFFESKPLIL